MSRLPDEPASSEITPEALYLRRREFIKNAALVTGTAVAVGGGLLWLTRGGPAPSDNHRMEATPKPSGGAAGAKGRSLLIASRHNYAEGEARNSFEEITTYNNFY